MDVEALQAQIDLSNSIAYDLVSSWVKPSTSSATSVSHTISRELEEYAKRPPRLGLGATVSQSSLATSREAAKLKGKLIGQKRRRDESNDNTRAMGAQGPYNGQDEDEGESRSSAISTKKPRVIRIFGKKPEDAESSIISKKQSTAGNSLDLPSTPTHVSPGAPNHTLPTTSSITCLNSSAESSPASAPHQAHSRLSSQSVPLLNLDGPPLVQMGNEMLAHPQEGASPKKKKRRRRRRKGRKGGGGEEAA